MKIMNKLPKVKMSAEDELSANRILKRFLKNKDEIQVITEAVYAMGNAVAKKMGIKKKEISHKAKGGNRRERKLKDEIKGLRRKIAHISNELHRRKIRRKATKREKEIMKNLKMQLEGGKTTRKSMLMQKEKWLDQLRYQKVKLEKLITRGTRIRNNAMFSNDEGSFYSRVNQASERIGKTPCMDEFVKFWGGIWENKETTPVQPWMDEIKERLSKKIKSVKEFVVAEDELSKVVKKRKNWSAPGIDGVQKY